MNNLDEHQIESLIREATWHDDIDDAAEHIQNGLGIRNGDTAAIYFSSREMEQDYENGAFHVRQKILQGYVDCEVVGE